jgi:hypothetical protein
VRLLVIREEQMQVFDSVSEANFERRLAGLVREIQPELVSELDEDDLLACVRVGIERARGHGLDSEQSIGIFVGWMLEIAPNFDEQPNIRKVLTYPGLAPEQRLELVGRLATEEDWEEAAEMYNEDVSGPETAEDADEG